MGRRGRFAHNYDATVLRRFTADSGAMRRLEQKISRRILDAVAESVEELGEELTDEHGLHPEVAQLLVAHMANDAVDFLRWVKAGEARSAGVPVRGLMDAMGYASPTSITRQVPTLDYVASVRAQADATGVAELIQDSRGYDIVLHPNPDAIESESVIQARKRGWLPESIAELTDPV